ncbi:hypothetical protein ES288_D06G225100v1 [Gossypium darwinii]|uniref:Secreted protein n=1 Tax=Gossypium darwinii TaxID=34276 RepID=A0A5D2CC72_GOSDA|nr:hypothetical protein ES288_D06G225100v1 [Gossypium darwinii]
MDFVLILFIILCFVVKARVKLGPYRYQSKLLPRFSHLQLKLPMAKMCHQWVHMLIEGKKRLLRILSRRGEGED